VGWLVGNLVGGLIADLVGGLGEWVLDECGGVGFSRLDSVCVI